MKKFILSFRGLAMGIVLFAFTSLNMGCLRETDCTAIITVQYASTGQPVVGATVKLDCNTCQPAGTLQSDQQITDGSGKTNHVFRYPAVLDITVSGQFGPPVTAVIKLEEGETVERTISI